MSKLKAAGAMLGMVMAVGFGQRQAGACSCGMPGPPLEALQAAAAVFEGEVLEDRIGGDGMPGHTWDMRVVQAWKGVSAGDLVSVLTGADSAVCGWDSTLVAGTRMLVYATSRDGNLATSICTRTRYTADAMDDLTALGPPSDRPQPAGGCAVTAPAIPLEGPFSFWLVPLSIAVGLAGTAGRRR